MFGKKKEINKKKAAKLGQLFKNQLDQAKEQFAQLEFESKAEDGSVSVVVTGTREIKCLSIDPELISGRKEQVEALVMSVVNDALRIVKAANIELTEAVTKSFNEQLGT